MRISPLTFKIWKLEKIMQATRSQTAKSKSTNYYSGSSTTVHRMMSSTSSTCSLIQLFNFLRACGFHYSSGLIGSVVVSIHAKKNAALLDRFAVEPRFMFRYTEPD